MDAKLEAEDAQYYSAWGDAETAKLRHRTGTVDYFGKPVPVIVTDQLGPDHLEVYVHLDGAKAGMTWVVRRSEFTDS